MNPETRTQFIRYVLVALASFCGQYSVFGLLIFAGPIWFVWAIIEMFLPFNPKDAARPFETNVNVSQNVNVPNALPDPSDDDDRVACPQCAEMIKINASKCRFCGIRV